MQEDADRAFLAPRLSSRAVDRYLSNLLAVERFLGIELDNTALDDGSSGHLRNLPDKGFDMPAAGLFDRDLGVVMARARRDAPILR